MSDTKLVVVGDRFDEFTGNKGVVSVSTLLWRLRHGDLPAGTAILVGQGLPAERLGELVDLVGRSGGRVRFAEPPPAHVERGLTHKRDARNVLISEPERAAPDEFVADLLIDERTETLADHLTGQHIPAITLTEAARQMWTAVTESFLLDETDRTRFVVNEFRSVFRTPVFPLPATVRYRLTDRRRDAVQQVFRCAVSIHQGGGAAAEVEASYRVIPEVLISRQEGMAARAAVRRRLTAPVRDTARPPVELTV